ncbi:hypothetical protein HII31_01161 [Pseudocercospora fuligena]|uniref:Beta-lactamase-related domain-containing protein n=1 Tax=Pseudocercospora fuligena TaxID=685502 RepID=A0A8H6RUF1_9PEZI|nr:hypothetical protein HII31_01161 [Pseudocercospora fuligena]
MGVLKDVERLLVSADDLNDVGIPSISMAFLQTPTSDIESLTITNGEENIETVYQACSISKAITALAVAKLIDLEHLSYATKVVDHVPEAYWKPMVDWRTEHLMQYVTVGMLVSHRSGLSQHGFPGYAGQPPDVKHVFDGQPPANTPRMRFLSFPGSQVSYSGGGFTLLQVLMEHVMQIPFPQMMQQVVLGPLGMSRSCYGDLPSDEDNYARAHLTAYTPGTTYTKGCHRFIELAAAGLWTTPSDLLKAVSAVQLSLCIEDGFLKQITAHTMLSKPTPDDTPLSMAMGWCADSTFFGHRGDNDPGYNCYFFGAHKSSSSKLQGHGMALQGHGLASIAVMSNSVEGWPFIKKIISAITLMKGWPLYETLPGGFGKMTDFVPFALAEGVFTGDHWKDFVGHWAVDRTGSSSNTSTSTPSAGSTGIATPSLISFHTEQTCGSLAREPEYEIYADEDVPMVAFDGIGQAMRLRAGACPWLGLDNTKVATLVVDGLQMAFRMMYTANGEQKMQLVQESVQELRRV